MTVVFSSGDFHAKWTIYEVDEISMADFQFKAPVDGWIAVGFKDSKGLPGSDVIWGQGNVVEDRYVNGTETMYFSHKDISLGGKDDLEKTSVNHVDGFTYVNCTRLLETGDHYDYVLWSNEGNLYLKWAYGKSKDNQSVAEGEELVRFFGTAEEEEMAQLKIHGIMMVLVVMVLMVAGMVLSRYLKLIFAWWFYAHTAIFCTAVFLVTVSAVIVFKAHNNTFVPGWHSVLGIFFLIGMGAQTLLGFVSHFKFDKKRTSAPFFPDKLHWYLGRSMLFLGILTVLIGLYALPTRHMAKYAFYAWCVVIFFFVLTLEKRIGQTHEVAVKGISEDDEAFGDDDDGLVYTPKKGNSLSGGHVPRQFSADSLIRLLVPSGFAIVILFIVVAVGISTSKV